MFLIAECSEGVIYIETLSDNNNRHAEWLSGLNGARVEYLNLSLAGGNILVGEDFRVVGASSVEMSTRRPIGDGNRVRALERIRSLDPRPLYVFGYRSPLDGERASDRIGPEPELLHQVAGHLDMFVSLTGLSRNGKAVILVADPESALAGDRDPYCSDLKGKLDLSARHLTEDGFEVIRN